MTGPTPLADLARERLAWRAAGRRVVLTNGCFDLLHPGHIALLEAARRRGGPAGGGPQLRRLGPGLKGEGRPVVPEAERAEALLALEAVDRVVLYDEPTPIEAIRTLLPDVLVKGADWAADQVVGRAEVEAAGGRLVRVALVPGRSTSAIVDRIRQP